ncbi:MAG: hypothetical protein PHD76_13450 [Methylacidiphilales bacterium]|nr:hypothetical protein [Candidatus Methylacidiphilales bacterium]
MNKTQFVILNILAVLASFLMLTRTLLLQNNDMLRQQLMQAQMEINSANNLAPLLQNLVSRINQAAQVDPDLKDLLKQYQIGPATKPAAGR